MKKKILQNSPKLEPYLDAFSSYVQTYYSADPLIQENISLKEEHSFRVLNYAQDIAISEGLEAEARFAIELSALFHDLGRFEQFSRYQTFQDKLSVNHALLGYKSLQEKQFCAHLPEQTKTYLGIAILMHNRLKVPTFKNKFLDVMVKMVRDADKLDILYVILNNLRYKSKNYKVVFNLKDEPDQISPAVVKTLEAKRLVDYSKLEFINDFKLLLVSWIYDFNFSYSYQVIKKNNWLESIFDFLPAQKKIENIYQNVFNYLDLQLKNR